jgi:hypothetical protein
LEGRTVVDFTIQSLKMMQDIVVDPRIVFKVESDRPRRVLVWGPSHEKISERLTLGFAGVRLQKKRIVAFTPSLEMSTLAKRAVLNLRTYEGREAAIKIVAKEQAEVVFIEQAHVLVDLEDFLDHLDLLNITTFLSAVSSEPTGQPWQSIADIFHTCRIHPIPDECQTCRGKEGFFRRTAYTKSLSESSDSETPSVITQCAVCFKKEFTGLPGLERLDTDSPTEFAQDIINLMNGSEFILHLGNEPILTCSEDSNELEDEFDDLSVEDKQRLGFNQHVGIAVSELGDQ